MKSIGIDDSTHDIYESSNAIWSSVWPAIPVLSVAAFVDFDKDLPTLEHDLSRAEILFREDSFDPITRIRRGRFYKSSDDQRPTEKNVLPHPIYGIYGSGSADGRCARRLYIFDQDQGLPKTNSVIIGSDKSLWRVLGAEKIISGEYLVTLKARHALAVLPELNAEAIPEIGRAKAIETFEKLVDSAYRETPGSIADRARDVAQWFLGTWLAVKNGDEKMLHEDLGSLIKKCEKYKELMSSVANAIRLLHSRGKPNEQARYSTWPLMEADAEFALAAVAVVTARV